jgi:hypothetical protein
MRKKEIVDFLVFLYNSLTNYHLMQSLVSRWVKDYQILKTYTLYFHVFTTQILSQNSNPKTL